MHNILVHPMNTAHGNPQGGSDSEKTFLFEEDEQQFIQALQAGSILGQADVSKLSMIVKSGRTDLSITQLILNLGMASETELLQFVSDRFGLKILAETDYPNELFGEQVFNQKFLREQNVVVVSETDEYIEICISDPFNPELHGALSFALGSKLLKIRLGYKKHLSDALDLVLRSGEDRQLVERLEDGDEVLLEKDIRQLKELASEAPVIKIVNSVIETAVQGNASDIHVEPHADSLVVRNRIDGVLVTVRDIPSSLAAAVVSRIKILSDLDIAQRRVPQDGRFDMNVDGQDVDIRVSVIPIIHGESIVLRLLYKKAISFDFDNLGYSPSNKAAMLRMLEKPHGMILVTGPTGSGKSTTLYAMLQQINSSEKKIVSVEDPVEYKVDGVNQIQVNSEIGVSFAKALSAIVRHDPEVIMVGEMRDSETAEIAIRASMTGHLILTTLHTNSAASSIDRLVDLGVERAFVMSSLVGVIAQRLVRRLCEHCKHPVGATRLDTDIGAFDTDYDTAIQIYEANGCQHCNQTGYRGRLSICEVLPVNDEFRAAALKHRDNVQQLAREYGMKSMVMDAFEKVEAGLTTIDELYRVVLE